MTIIHDFPGLQLLLGKFSSAQTSSSSSFLEKFDKNLSLMFFKNYGTPLAPRNAGKICPEAVASCHAEVLAIIVYNNSVVKSEIMPHILLLANF